MFKFPRFSSDTDSTGFITATFITLCPPLALLLWLLGDWGVLFMVSERLKLSSESIARWTWPAWLSHPIALWLFATGRWQAWQRYLMGPGPTFIKPDQLDPWIKDQIKITLLAAISPLQLPNYFCVMWEGQALPHDTKFRNCRGKIVDSRAFPSWSLIHGSSWSGLIKVGPGFEWTPPLSIKTSKPQGRTLCSSS